MSDVVSTEEKPHLVKAGDGAELEMYGNPSETKWRQLRALDLTSTEVAALFNASPYVTYFELWHRKKDQMIVNLSLGERAEWGQILEPAIARGVLKMKGWPGQPFKDYIRDPQHRLGASFDWLIIDDGEVGSCPLEIKNVDSLVFKNDWIIDENSDDIEAPPHIEFQVQSQLAVLHKPRAYIGVLVGGNRISILKRDANPVVIEAIRAKAAAFWKSIDENQPPQPDFSQDLSTISRLYGYAEPNKVLDATNDEELKELCRLDGEYLAQEKDLEVKRSTVKAKTLAKIGDAEKVLLAPGFSISAGVIPEAFVPAHTRKGYRLLRFNRPRAKK